MAGQFAGIEYSGRGAVPVHSEGGAGVSGLRDVAARLREQEGGLAGGYEELEGAADREVERSLAGQVARYQRLQLMSLELLADGVPEPFMGFGLVNGEEVNLREGPGGRFPLVGRLARGEMVILKGYNGYWVQVQVPKGRSGYVFKDYVQQETLS